MIKNLRCDLINLFRNPVSMTHVVESKSVQTFATTGFPKSSNFLAVYVVVGCLLLTSCETTSPASGEFEFDYANAKVSDFDGTWEGPVKCSNTGGWMPYTVIVIKDGVGTLSNFGNWGKSEVAEIDPSNGKITWKGTYDNNEGDTTNPFTMKGKWMGSKFELKGRRGGTGICTAVLSKDPHKITGVKRKTLRFVAYDPEDYVPVFQGNWRIN